MNLKMVGLISSDLCVLRFMGAMRAKMPGWSHLEPPDCSAPSRSGTDFCRWGCTREPHCRLDSRIRCRLGTDASPYHRAQRQLVSGLAPELRSPSVGRAYSRAAPELRSPLVGRTREPSLSSRLRWWGERTREPPLSSDLRWWGVLASRP
jgi:hypothetical protein